jgi:hypothetical protein
MVLDIFKKLTSQSGVAPLILACVEEHPKSTICHKVSLVKSYQFETYAETPMVSSGCRIHKLRKKKEAEGSHGVGVSAKGAWWKNQTAEDVAKGIGKIALPAFCVSGP